jgi:hypothetical protein
MKKMFAALLISAALAPSAFAYEPELPPPPPESSYMMPPPPPGLGFLGAGPLVNNVVTVGVQANVQNGEGNVGVNVLEVGQSAGAFGAGSLVNSVTAVGAQLNTQNGYANSALNQAFIGQSALAGFPVLLPPN